MRASIKLKRVYEAPQLSDGMRILVDRLWPRGLSKQKAAIDLWCREVAPSAELRKWFGHDAARWTEFGERYRQELAAKADQVAELRGYLRKRSVTLLYAAHDTEHNQAIVLRDVLRARPTAAKVKTRAEARPPAAPKAKTQRARVATVASRARTSEPRTKPAHKRAG